jgi:hypothetical protein
MPKNFKFTNDWIAGFTQSDGSFVVTFSKQNKGIPIRPVPVFNITQSITELDLFVALQKHLGVGKLYKNRQNVVFVVKSIDEIVNTILPLFDKHQVRGGKLLAYNIFKKVSLMIKNKKHLTVEGTLQILNLAYFMNKDTSLRSIESFNFLKDKLSISPLISEPSKFKVSQNNVSILEKDTIKPMSDDSPLTFEFVRGLIDGDGSFNVAFATTRRRITVNFTVVSELSSNSVLNQLIDFFNCGTVYNLPSLACRYQVQSVDDILNKVITIFKNTQFNTKKQERFEIIIKICEIIKNRGYSNDDDLKTIVDLAWNMNILGRRKISKEEYLNKFIKQKKKSTD